MMDKILIETKFNYNRKGVNGGNAHRRAQMVRSYVQDYTLGWGTEGVRLLPYRFFETVKKCLDTLPEDNELTLEHYYLPYPEQKEGFTEELARREAIALGDLKKRIRASLELLITKLAADYDKGRNSSKLHKSVIDNLVNEAPIYRAMNSLFKDEQLDNVINGLEGLGRFEIQELRTNGSTRAKAVAEAQLFINVLSNA
jgi:hypothetical protein